MDSGIAAGYIELPSQAANVLLELASSEGLFLKKMEVFIESVVTPMVKIANSEDRWRHSNFSHELDRASYSRRCADAFANIQAFPAVHEPLFHVFTNAAAAVATAATDGPARFPIALASTAGATHAVSEPLTSVLAALNSFHSDTHSDAVRAYADFAALASFDAASALEDLGSSVSTFVATALTAASSSLPPPPLPSLTAALLLPSQRLAKYQTALLTLAAAWPALSPSAPTPAPAAASGAGAGVQPLPPRVLAAWLASAAAAAPERAATAAVQASAAAAEVAALTIAVATADVAGAVAPAGAGVVPLAAIADALPFLPASAFTAAAAAATPASAVPAAVPVESARALAWHLSAAAALLTALGRTTHLLLSSSSSASAPLAAVDLTTTTKTTTSSSNSGVGADSGSAAGAGAPCALSVARARLRGLDIDALCAQQPPLPAPAPRVLASGWLHKRGAAPTATTPASGSASAPAAAPRFCVLFPRFLAWGDGERARGCLRLAPVSVAEAVPGMPRTVKLTVAVETEGGADAGAGWGADSDGDNDGDLGGGVPGLRSPLATRHLHRRSPGSSSSSSAGSNGSSGGRGGGGGGGLGVVTQSLLLTAATDAEASAWRRALAAAITQVTRDWAAATAGGTGVAVGAGVHAGTGTGAWDERKDPLTLTASSASVSVSLAGAAAAGATAAAAMTAALPESVVAEARARAAATLARAGLTPASCHSGGSRPPTRPPSRLPSRVPIAHQQHQQQQQQQQQQSRRPQRQRAASLTPTGGTGAGAGTDAGADGEGAVAAGAAAGPSSAPGPTRGATGAAFGGGYGDGAVTGGGGPVSLPPARAAVARPGTSACTTVVAMAAVVPGGVRVGTPRLRSPSPFLEVAARVRQSVQAAQRRLAALQRVEDEAVAAVRTEVAAVEGKVRVLVENARQPLPPE